MTKQKKILVCDDDEAILEVIKIMLEESGFAVKGINSGKQIVKKIQEYLPDLILLDIWMPGIDGKEILTILKRDKVLKKIPVVVISALSDTKKIAKEKGAEGFLNKPFEMTELIKITEKFTNG